MPRKPHLGRRCSTALTWPVGITLTSIDYTRTTPLHRVKTREHDETEHRPPRLPDGIDVTDIVSPEDGAGPVFHRHYATTIRDSDLDADVLFATLAGKLSRAVPLKMARFHTVLGQKHQVALGDEYVDRLPGPWDDGPRRRPHRPLIPARDAQRASRGRPDRIPGQPASGRDAAVRDRVLDAQPATAWRI